VETGDLVAEINKRPGGSKDQGDHNGDMIVAAPEMMVACLEAIRFLQLLRKSDGCGPGDRSWSGSEDPGPIIDELCSAIDPEHV
jgi:hypothetical protein